MAAEKPTWKYRTFNESLNSVVIELLQLLIHWVILVHSLGNDLPICLILLVCSWGWYWLNIDGSCIRFFFEARL